MRTIRVLLSAIAALVAIALNIAPCVSQPSDPPGKLGLWEGHWTYSGQIYQTAYSQAHSDTGVFDCDWMPNRGYMVCDYFSDDPPHDNLSIFSYSPAAKAYTHVGVFKDSKPHWEKVTLSGNTWITPTETTYRGKMLGYRTVMVFLSADKQLTMVQASADRGRTWLTLIKITAEKVAS